MNFEGFPAAALDFYDDLEMDNTRTFWEANKHVYVEAVRGPMTALTVELASEFGQAKVFRPYRDVRFSKDKVPYKTHQGAFISIGPQTGFYVEISPRGVRAGSGCYHFEPDRLASFRASIDDERLGPELEALVEGLEAQGLEIGGDKLKTRPRGWEIDHPRIELLRHKSLIAGRQIGFDPVIHTPQLVDKVRDTWRTLRPLSEWITQHSRV